ncbi:E3 ubiquitin-protein ligase upl6 [Turnera subulata]|uniref:HECT-type E3 ubiquitin transferase n=1 Tax=Turnera subulata TaxID=218843 RepID=A0A9Q0F0U5_9ROSI|nr:E3 ubiquitin-protein ligase upl6 [Turnera subulata]
MFFSGDPTTRKRVDLGGRSSKERDRQKLLEQTRLERNRRLWLRQQNAAALKIQKCYRGRKVVEAERSKVREQFYGTYGKCCENVDRSAFGAESDFLPRLFFLINPENTSDIPILVETARLLLQMASDGGLKICNCGAGIVNLFAGADYSVKRAAVDYRVKQLAFTCIQAVYQNREQFRDQLLITSGECNTPATLLLEVVLMLIDPRCPWACKVVSYLLQKKTFALCREIALMGKDNSNSSSYLGKVSSLERILMLVISHDGRMACTCSDIDPQWSFSSQMLTVPLLWNLFPSLKEVFATQELSQHYIHQMADCVQHHANILPNDVSGEYPGHACLLGNMLEAAGVTLSQPNCSFQMALDLASVTTFLLDALPPFKSPSRETKESTLDEDDMNLSKSDEMEIILNENLGQQITNAMNSRFLLQLINVLFREISLVNDPSYRLDDKAFAAVGAVCGFLHVTFNTLPLDLMMTVLAYRTDLVRVLWNFMKQCHVNQKWSSLPERFSYLPGDAPGWLLPLAVFCPVYKHMLTIIDNEEFYEHQKPLSFEDIRHLLVILRQTLWQLLWVNPVGQSNSNKPVTISSIRKRNPIESVKLKVSIVASELLSQLQDWNNRRQFTSPSDFHADGVDDSFIAQAIIDGTKANDILKRAPFLIPFTSRAKIFSSQLLAVRQRNGTHGVLARSRFRIRRDHILEDAYNQMSALSEEDLRGSIRVSFINEFGVEEAGIDGGGIFKDFMENIARAAFDVQYGLFKETADHLLYPNPGSGLIHEQHLQFFHFLGTLLAKAMFEGILVDIPFATFFLSKLKEKYNYLNDLPSLDPELYRHLIFLKHYQGNVSDLELYFVIVNNEYGEQAEEELLAGGKDKRVTNENVITFIHLVSNHRLNYQIRQQSSHFLRGFKQLIQKDWIDMFNEHELQLLISGSLESLDIDDLRSHTNYAGGYHSEHYVIEMFWEVLKGFSSENQKKFLKAAGSASDEDLDRLPTSATCMNLLKLPPYRSKEQLERKLLYAINAEAGFDLS